MVTTFACIRSPTAGTDSCAVELGLIKQVAEIVLTILGIKSPSHSQVFCKIDRTMKSTDPKELEFRRYCWELSIDLYEHSCST
jgi:hypothetical protein